MFSNSDVNSKSIVNQFSENSIAKTTKSASFLPTVYAGLAYSSGYHVIRPYNQVICVPTEADIK